MLFGWKKKAKPEGSEISQPFSEKDTKLSDVENIISDIMDLRKKTLISQINTFQKKISPNLEEILKIIKKLERDDLDTEDIDKHLKTIVIRGKKQVISIIKTEAVVKFEKIESLDGVLNFETQISQVLKKIGDVLGRQSRVIHIFAKKYAVKLKTVLSSMNSDKDEIQNLIKNFNHLEENEQNVIKNLKLIEDNNSEIKNGKKRIVNFDDSLKKLDDNINKKEDSIDKLKNTKEFSEYQKINSKIESLSDERDQIKKKIDIQFTKISRPLNKYSYISSLDREQKKILESLLKNPFEVLIPNNKSDIETILNSVLRSVQSGNVSVKDIEKSIQQINETNKMLDEFLGIVEAFEGKKSSMEKDLDVFDINELNQQKNDLKKILKEKEDLETRIQSLKNELEGLSKSNPKLIIDIEIWLKEISGAKYRVLI